MNFNLLIIIALTCLLISSIVIIFIDYYKGVIGLMNKCEENAKISNANFTYAIKS